MIDKNNLKIAMGADHGGYGLKTQLKEYLSNISKLNESIIYIQNL